MADVNVNDLERTLNVEKTLRPETPDRPAMNTETPRYNSAMNAAGSSVCPVCGALIDADADYCEACQNYIRKDVCSFCGAHLDAAASFCPECGNPRGGITCPSCHSLNNFSFCKQCGTPLTDEARALFASMREASDYKELELLSRQLSELDNIIPYDSEDEALKDAETENLRVRVLELLAKDEGIENPTIERHTSRRMSAEELKEAKRSRAGMVAKALERMALRPMPSPVKARNYVMATKPVGVKVAWQCNYKHALHSSPCGCAKPHLGGKWVVLGYNNNEQIKDDINDK